MGEPLEPAEAEESEDASSGPGPLGAAAAVAMAFGRLKPGAKLAPEAAAFLKEQSRLAGLQSEHLHEQREVQLSHLRLRRLNERLKAALQMLTIAVGAVIALALAAMAWRAHEDHGVAIEAFS